MQRSISEPYSCKISSWTVWWVYFFFCVNQVCSSGILARRHFNNCPSCPLRARPWRARYPTVVKTSLRHFCADLWFSDTCMDSNVDTLFAVYRLCSAILAVVWHVDSWCLTKRPSSPIAFFQLLKSMVQDTSHYAKDQGSRPLHRWNREHPSLSFHSATIETYRTNVVESKLSGFSTAVAE